MKKILIILTLFAFPALPTYAQDKPKTKHFEP